MSTDGLQGGKKDTDSKAQARRVPCLHDTLVGRWDSLTDVGSEAKAIGFRCVACEQFFTRDEGLALRVAQDHRQKGRDDPLQSFKGLHHLGDPVCFYCRHVGNETLAKIPIIGWFSEMANWSKCSTEGCGLWVCDDCFVYTERIKGLTEFLWWTWPSKEHVCPNCRGTNFSQIYGPQGEP